MVFSKSLIYSPLNPLLQETRDKNFDMKSQAKVP